MTNSLEFTDKFFNDCLHWTHFHLSLHKRVVVGTPWFPVDAVLSRPVILPVQVGRHAVDVPPSALTVDGAVAGVAGAVVVGVVRGELGTHVVRHRIACRSPITGVSMLREVFPHSGEFLKFRLTN